MEQISLADVKKRSIIGVLSLSIRNIGIQSVSIVGFFLLTILLGPAEVGLFAIVAESVALLGYFSDIGLASALIQQKQPPSKQELRTTFTIQQVLVITGLLIVALIYPKLASLKNYGPIEMAIVISLCVSFVAASLKTIPSVLLERDLNFKLLSSVDVVENIAFYVVAVLFAYFGFGGYSYAIAATVRSLLGLILIYRLQQWPFGVAFHFSSARKLFRYGIPFQANSLIAVAKDRVSTILVAGIIGREGFGILSWAQKITRLPLSFMDTIIRVAFPAFSRFQDSPEIIHKAITRTIYFVAIIIFPASTLIALSAKDLILSIPKYNHWLPAVYPIYFISISAMIAAITTPITNAFNATGKISVTVKLMIMWTVLTWMLYPPLSIQYGYIGTAYATLLVGLSSFVVWYLCARVFKVNVILVIIRPVIGCLIILVSVLLTNQLQLSSITNLVTKVIVGVASYSVFIYIFSKREIQWFKQAIGQGIFGKL